MEICTHQNGTRYVMAWFKKMSRVNVQFSNSMLADYPQNRYLISPESMKVLYPRNWKPRGIYKARKEWGE